VEVALDERLSWQLLRRAGEMAETMDAAQVCKTLWAAAALRLLLPLSTT